MAEHEQVTITDEEIERDIAEVRASAATRENYDELLNEEARNSSLRKKYKGQTAAQEKFYAGLLQPEKRASARRRRTGDVEAFRVPEIASKLPKTMTGRYASAQLWEAKLFWRALADGVVHPKATDKELNAYRLAHGKAKARTPVMRLSFSGYDPTKHLAGVNEAKKLSSKLGAKLKLSPAKLHSSVAGGSAADETREANPKKPAEASA